MLADEVYMAMLEIGHSAKRDNVPGPLSETMLDTARQSLDMWRSDHSLLQIFARILLRNPSGLKEATSNLPERTRNACWRLLNLLQYVQCETVSVKNGGDTE